MHELQELHRKLDVTQATRPELDLAIRVRRRHVFEHSTSHCLDVGDESFALRRSPDERGNRVDIRPPERGVAGNGSRLEQRLELPRLGPALVVGLVAGQRPHQRSRLALGPQAGVDRPDRPFGRRLGADPHHRGCER